MGMLQAHLETWRPYTVLYAGAVGLAGATTAERLTSAHALSSQLVAAFVIPIVGWVAGLYGGDYFDRRLDAVAKPQRPIPSGRMHPNEALAGLVSGTLGGLLITVLINPRAAVLVVVSAVLALSYNAIFKSRGLLGHVVRGSVMAVAFVFGAMMVAPYPTASMLVPAAIFWLHDTASNIVGAIRDVEEDRKAGYLTLPARHGVTVALNVCFLLVGCWTALTITHLALTTPRWGIVAGCGAVAAALVSLLSIRSLTSAPLGSLQGRALTAHTGLIGGRLVLACAVVSATRPVLAILLLVPSALFSLLTAGALRQRHEFANKGAST